MLIDLYMEVGVWGGRGVLTWKIQISDLPSSTSNMQIIPKTPPPLLFENFFWIRACQDV